MKLHSKIQTYVVVMRITQYAENDPPGMWLWGDLLDLGTDESCEVESCELVKEEEIK
jgi:hypothetical protein